MYEESVFNGGDRNYWGLLISGGHAFAQPGMKWRGGGGWGAGNSYGRMYDLKSVETVSGEVEGLDKMVPMKGMSYGIHLLLKTDNEELSVHLGPAWYIENQDVKIEPGDKVEIKGSKITFKGKPVLIAAEVKKGGQVLRLRDEESFPYWAGWRKR